MRAGMVAALGLALAACSGSRSDPAVVATSGLVIEVAVEPAALRVGENSLWIELRDDAGAPVPDARVQAAVTMQAMGAMPAMGGPAAVTEIDAGRYRADFALEMGGTWAVAIEAQARGGPAARAEGSLTVGTAGLRLTPGAAAAVHPAEFRLEPCRMQRIGVKNAPAALAPFALKVRAVGRVVADEAALADVALKIGGWVAAIRADTLGVPVQKGDVLFEVSSPELRAAQLEYLLALRSRSRGEDLVRAARNRLRLWGAGDAELERIAQGGEPLPQLPVRSPVTGYVVEKNLVAGSAFTAGQRLYRIAPLARVWIEADVYESDLPLVQAGQRAFVTLPAWPERSFEASVAAVIPAIDAQTRTARVRLELPNPDLALRPGMYANVLLHADRGERLVVPQSAVLYAGERSFVFRALGDGRFRPQRVDVGLRSGEQVEIVAGIEPGDAIVTSATFLIASESRLRAALEQW